MKILSIVGSPRINANTHYAAQKFCEGAAKAGAEVQEVILNKLEVGPCIHCDACIEEGGCNIEDDFPGIVEKMDASDGILLSSPVYCGSVTGQMKCFFDRCYSLTYPTWESSCVLGKPAFFIVGAGYPFRKDDPDYVMHHKLKFKTLLNLLKSTKLVQPNMSMRALIDPMAPIDPCVGALTLLHSFCVNLGMEPIGSIGLEGLGYGRKAVRNRVDEIQNVVESGAGFTAMARLLKEDAYM